MIKINNYRRSDIDFLKAIGIFLVVLGHFPGEGGFIHAFPNIFHMPLFFMLSGLVKKDTVVSYKEYIIKKAKSLLYPYFVLGFIVVLYNTTFSIIYHDFSVIAVLKRVAALLYGNVIWENNSGYIGTLWFLICLFCVEVIFDGLSRKFKTKKSLLVAIIAVSALGFVVSWINNQTISLTSNGYGYRLPFCFDIALVAISFYGFGYLIKDIEFKKRMFYGPACFILGVLVASLNYYIVPVYKNTLKMSFGIYPMFILSAILCSFGLYLLVGWYCKHTENFILNRLVCSMGKNSLLIMVVHLYLQEIIFVAENKFYKIDNWIVNLLILFAASYLLSLLVSKFLPFLYRHPKFNKSKKNEKKELLHV